MTAKRLTSTKNLIVTLPFDAHIMVAAKGDEEEFRIFGVTTRCLDIDVLPVTRALTNASSSTPPSSKNEKKEILFLIRESC